jgi:hypothetical protein
MHHQSHLADLVDLLAVGFDIVDTTGRRLEAGGKPQSVRQLSRVLVVALG